MRVRENECVCVCVRTFACESACERERVCVRMSVHVCAREKECECAREKE